MSINLSNAWENGTRLVDSVIYLLPNMALAVVAFCVFLILASVKSIVQRLTARRVRCQSLGILFGQLARTLVIILGFLISLSIVAPSFRAGDLVKLLGIGSFAIGFAFQNILQNFLAGILLLMQEPFELGDWINVNGLEGRVDDIQTRATIIATRDGQKVVIPNALIFTSPVVFGNSQNAVA